MMVHLLDSYPFTSAIWDMGVMMFRRSNRNRGQPSQTIREWSPRAFKNTIIRTIWDAFPGMAMWCVWKERNFRIFCNQCKDTEAVWNTVKENLLSLTRFL